ncbi:hypothetical protein K8R47_00345 [archaeon]|nr:hypothetical protein [archaeon]
MKKILIILILVLFYSGLSYAADIKVDIIPVNDVILEGETALFDLDIMNMQNSADKLTYVIYDQNWNWEKKFFDLSSGSMERLRLELIPYDNLSPDRYSVNLRVYSVSDPDVYTDKSLLVEYIGYDEILDVEELSNVLSEGLDPKKTNILKLNIKNKYDINLEGITLKLESDIFTEEKIIDLNGLEEKDVEFSIDIEDDVLEGIYNIKLYFTSGDKVLVDRLDDISVGVYSDVQENKIESSGFLLKRLLVDRENKGNSISEEEYSTRLNSFEKTFTKFNPEPTKLEKVGDQYYYYWNFNLNPNEIYSISIVTNYRTSLLILIIVILLVWIITSLSRKGISIRKKVLTIKTGEGISEIKVLLILKNKSKKVNQVRVIDQLPNVVEMPKEFGTIRPTKIKKTSNRGVMLIWDIPGLIKGEERIISYKVKSRIHVIGKLFVPRAIVRYKGLGRKNLVVRSNAIKLFS